MIRIGRLRNAIAEGIRGFGAWQAAIPDQGRVVLVGLILLAAAFAAAGLLPLALGVPAGVLVVIGVGVDFTDRRTGPVLIGSLAVVVAVALMVAR